MRNIFVHGLAVLSLAVVGCGGSSVSIDEGPMPSGGSFTGVWHSPQYGRMEMTQTGSQVAGSYVRDERSGRIQGTVRGNVMRFEWSEQREMVAGHPITTRGRGYFRYGLNGDGDPVIDGEWGVDDAMSGGGPWQAVRDRRARPSSSSGTTSSSGGETEGAFEEFDSADDSDGSRSSGSDSGGGGLDLDGL